MRSRAAELSERLGKLGRAGRWQEVLRLSQEAKNVVTWSAGITVPSPKCLVSFIS